MKTTDVGYKNIFLKEFNQLKNLLLKIFADNPNNKEFKFYGVEKNGRKGLKVDGMDSSGITNFSRFYSISDIFYYNQNRINELFYKL